MQDVLLATALAKAEQAPGIKQKFFEEHTQDFKTALLIREVETALLNLFSEGKLNGTIHTCVGQELTGVAIANSLQEDDWITSNHRCHGHFIAKTGRWQDLIDELLGLASGVCGGIGSSQHLFANGFFSNGTQGSLLPVASGLAYSFKRNSTDQVVVSFIGEGTLGEGNVYETLNLSSVLSNPHVIVCENNYYSQSTPQANVFAGSIEGRARSFDWQYHETNTWDIENLFSVCATAINDARTHSRPNFINISTYRLNSHSKGDDDRDKTEINHFREVDSLNQLVEKFNLQDLVKKITEEVSAHIAEAQKSTEIFSFAEYTKDQLPRNFNTENKPVNNPKLMMVKALNSAYDDILGNGCMMVGEDLDDPYGGAFKVTKGLQEKYPNQVLSTPISEAGITGLGIGLSMAGTSTFVEIMFGDFITNATDQIVNNACKFYHMYALQKSAPVRIRAPMGGRRGYGPTHSQSLEKMYLGLENLAVFAPTSLIDPKPLINFVSKTECPSLIVENKVDYGAFLWTGADGLELSVTGGDAGTVKVTPVGAIPEVSIITYGMLGRLIADNYLEIFTKSDVVFELHVLQQLHPIPFQHFSNSVANTKSVIVVEDSSPEFGWGNEVVFTLSEEIQDLKAKRLGALPVSIPSIRELEDMVLPSVSDVVIALKNAIEE